jgi:hypothetical protein
MTMVKSRAARAVVAVVSVTAFLRGGLAIAPSATAATPGTVLRVAITSHGMYLNGPTTFPAGRVKLFMDAAGNDRGVAIIRLARGYSFHDFRTDLKVAFQNLFAPDGNTDKGLRRLNHALDNVTAYGGLYAHDGAIRHGTLLLDRPGNRYVLFDDSGNLPKRPIHLTVTAPEGPQTLPSTAATVTARTGARFGGDTELPAHGNITFRNRATDSPHFLVFQHVKKGTTRKDVLDSFQSNTPPDFALPGNQDVDVVSPGHAMTVRLHLPKGYYAEMCFFPDPKTGTPHAFMGMVRIVHLT